MTQARPRIVLADDHAQTAQLLRQLLHAEFEVVALVHDGRALVDAAERLSPDVIVSDIRMAELDGMTAAEMILAKHPAAKIILMSVSDDPSLIEHGLSIGVSGYVLKLAAGEELIPAVHAALRGERHVSGCDTPPAAQ